MIAKDTTALSFYAEMLLASAKSKDWQLRAAKPEAPYPACLDWESVTDGLLDSVHNRRQRELFFRDKTCQRIIQLTQRPCCLAKLADLADLCEQLDELPASIRYEDKDEFCL